MRSSITSLPPRLIHAFTGPNCAGNPAWVVPVQPTADIHATAAQYLARPGATACALLLPATHRNSSITLRSFGPSGEIQLCGHALLCAAHWLWSHGKQEPLHFDLPACQQRIRATRLHDETCLTLPSNNYRLCSPPEGLATLIGQRILRCARSTALPGSLIVELHSESAVREVQLNATALMRLTTDCVLITARSHRPGIDVASRYFTPAYGALEDPATGSAHCLIANWWRGRLGSRPLRCWQASPQGGWLQAQHMGSSTRIWGKCSTL